MWSRLLISHLLLFALLHAAHTIRERESNGYSLRSRNAKLREAFRRLRISFQKSHPDLLTKTSELSTQTKSVTVAPFLQEDVFIQLSNGAAERQQAASRSEFSNSTADVLFSVWTDSNFYDSRLTGILKTWGKEIAPEQFVAISDKKRSPSDCKANSNLPGCRVHETQCPPHSHWEGACCKWAEGIINAQEQMAHNPHLKWAFFSDDDVYLRPKAVADALRAHDLQVDPKKPQALGIFGCTTPGGCGGLCGGGGFAINRAAADRMASKDPVALLNEEMSWCSKCDRWADQAVSMIWKDRGIEMQQLPGLNGWIMKEDVFKQQLVNGNPNLLFHYEKTEHQMEALHEMFTGEALLTKHDGPCVEYQGRKTCAASALAGDVPYVMDHA